MRIAAAVKPLGIARAVASPNRVDDAEPDLSPIAGSEATVALRAGEAFSVDCDPGVGAPVGLRVSGIPLLAMPGMACLCLLSHEHEAAIEKLEQGIDDPTPFVDTELVLIEEHLAATEEIQARAMLVDVHRIAEGDPVPGGDGDIPEPIDWASPIPVDEGDRLAATDHDVLDADVVVAHQPSGEAPGRGDPAPPPTFSRSE